MTGRKKVKGRKRHIATDTLWNMLEVQVHAANVYDTKRGWQVCDRAVKKYPTIEAFSADGSYRGTTLEFVENILGLRLDISSKLHKGFQVILKRWIVERTVAWLGRVSALVQRLRDSHIHGRKLHPHRDDQGYHCQVCLFLTQQLLSYRVIIDRQSSKAISKALNISFTKVTPCKKRISKPVFLLLLPPAFLLLGRTKRPHLPLCLY